LQHPLGQLCQDEWIMPAPRRSPILGLLGDLGTGGALHAGSRNLLVQIVTGHLDREQPVKG
jgi:hypothetical protein